MAVWGFRRGLSVSTVALAGFGAGAVLGASVAPLVLDGGLGSSNAPLLAFPAALLFGGLGAAVVERVGLRQGRRLARRLHCLGSTGAIAGALLAGCLGLVAAWILGAAVAQVELVKDPVKRSAILKRLNAVVTPPGPAFAAPPASDRLPILDGPAPEVLPGNPRVARDPEIQAAARSVVRIAVTSCDWEGAGSGWVAADGIVVTNAHVVDGQDETTLQLQGRGPDFPATPIWFDRKNDIALLRTPGLRGVRPLSIVPKPKAGTSGAVLGFPGGIRQRADIRPARLGATSARGPGRVEGTRPESGFPPELYGRSVTSFAGNVTHGSSGGPVVDTRGRVLATAFLRFRDAVIGLGVPNAIVRSALRRAGRPVDTGPCRDAG